MLTTFACWMKPTTVHVLFPTCTTAAVGCLRPRRAGEDEVCSTSPCWPKPRMQLLGEAADLMRFLFIGADQIEYNEKAVAKLRDTAPAALAAAAEVLAGIEDFTAENIKAALDAKLVTEMQIKPRFAFGPLFVAMTAPTPPPSRCRFDRHPRPGEAVKRIEKLLAHLG